MIAVREFSSGGIVLRQAGDIIEVLLIKDSYGRWTWPKGKIDADEKPRDAAVREVGEEAGLTGLTVIGRVGKSQYFFKSKGSLIFKTVYFYLMSAGSNTALKIQHSEIQDGRWFKLDEAKGLLAYEGSGEILNKAFDLYRTPKSAR